MILWACVRESGSRLIWQEAKRGTLNSRSYVSQVENGHYSASLDAIIAFANVLKVVPSDLLKEGHPLRLFPTGRKPVVMLGGWRTLAGSNCRAFEPTPW
jgi:transcriptional regulator with XRE-family HTH domain